MRFRPLPAEKVIKALTKIGFRMIRQKGSHVFLQHQMGELQWFQFIRERKLGEVYC
mgnify:CR=1 FL=1